jgi:dihydrofolate reductase
MRKLIYFMMVSLDGFVETPDHSLEWADVDAEVHQFANDLERQVGATMYGRRMYELMQAYWPTAYQNPDANPVEIEYSHIYNAIPKLVFSKTLAQVGDNARLFRGDNLVDEVKKLKIEPGKDISLGGANLASALIKAGLVDEYQLIVHPVAIGSGTPYFPRDIPPIPLKLLDTKRFNNGAVFLHYTTIE